nr:MAG TPA: hypothetical protein [Caudoviricetes sp.]
MPAGVCRAADRVRGRAVRPWIPPSRAALGAPSGRLPPREYGARIGYGNEVMTWRRKILTGRS